MLQSIRKNSQGIIAYFILGIMILAMAAFGVGPLLESIGGLPEAAKVNGQEISEIEVQTEVQRQKQQMYLSGVSDISDDLVREQVLTRMINTKLIEQAAADLDLDVSQSVINQQIVNNPAFASVDGYDPQTFQLAIRQQGYTPESFSKALSADYVLQQYVSGLTGSAFATEQELAALWAVVEQKRSFEYGVISAERFAAQQVSEEALQDRYADSSQRFLTPATMTVDYVQLNRDDLMNEVTVTDEQLAREFAIMQANADSSGVKLVAHILVTPKGDGSEAATIAAVESALAEGEDFGALAAQYSDDFASAEYDGEIGETSGESFDPAIEDAVANLSAGEVSGPINTDFGTHFVKVVSEEAGDALVFDDVKDQLVTQVKNLEVERIYAAKVEELREAAYSFGDIATLAESLGYTLSTSTAFNSTSGEGVMANAELRAMAFSSEVREDRLISDMLEIDDGEAVVIAMNAYEPSRVQTLDEVRSLLTAELMQEQATEASMALAAELVEGAQKGANLSDLFAEHDIQWLVAQDVTRGAATVAPFVLQKAFELATPQDDTSKAYYAEVLLDGTVAIYGLKGASDGLLSQLPEDQYNGMVGFLASVSEAAEQQALQQTLEASSDIERR